MTIDSAFRRIVIGHIVVIVVGVLLGAGLTALWLSRQPQQYLSVVRIMTDGSLPTSNVQADAISTQVIGIVTSPATVRQALDAGGLADSPEAFARTNITVDRVGVAPIVDLGVRAPSATQARIVAASLADQTLTVLNADRVVVTEDDVNRELAKLDATISTQQKSIRAAIDAMGSASVDRMPQWQARVTTLQASLTESYRQRAAVLADTGGRTAAKILDGPTTGSTPVPVGWPPRIALGALAGLLVGLGAAGLREAHRPVLRGPRDLAEAMGTVPLPPVDRTRPERARDDIRPLCGALTVRLQAHGSRRVHLVPLTESAREASEWLADALAGPLRQGALGTVVAAPLDRPVTLGSRPAAVIVIRPGGVAEHVVEDAQRLLADLGWPVVGVIRVRGRQPGAETAVADASAVAPRTDEPGQDPKPEAPPMEAPAPAGASTPAGGSTPAGAEEPAAAEQVAATPVHATPSGATSPTRARRTTKPTTPSTPAAKPRAVPAPRSPRKQATAEPRTRARSRAAAGGTSEASQGTTAVAGTAAATGTAAAGRKRTAPSVERVPGEVST